MDLSIFFDDSGMRSRIEVTISEIELGSTVDTEVGCHTEKIR